ncbi:uncharacterized protein [Neodiprion pinetum]|uniref:uncharacterized protein LOC124183651 n=1 Tax=Neodiprion fabricii TaxID=2872261 RepID=UPI001ED8D3EB|nr:uncharacterized protein LOC124183651 [Neodiprion fabricii]XP_046484561.1 uncharacterized protein LOC124220136 [Neodiprion pinetum]XP_046623035.1 uncharacterized protein LOC124306399 [Neodiprion virginianus]
MLGTWQVLAEQRSRSEESCPSMQSYSEEYMTLEGFYLMSNFRNPLTKALSDITSKKPYNPAEYLGHWLLNYKICEERAQKQKEFDAELQAERERLRIKVVSEPEDLDRVQDMEEELVEDWNFIDYEAD